MVSRLKQHATLKLALVVGLGLLICVPYFATVHTTAGRAALVPATTLDVLVPYSEAWAWAYVSLYALLLAPLVSTSREAIVRHARAVAAACVASHLCFVLLPTAPGVAAPEPTSWLMRAVVALDGPANALPSLHASLAALTALAAPDLFRGRRVAIAAWSWAAAIGYGALATRRHVAIDIAAGVAVALAARALARRGSTDRAETMPAVAPTPASTEQARRLVSRGIEAELAVLRRLDWRSRAVEFAAFAGLWLAGATTALLSVAYAEAPARWLGAAAGVAASAVAINAFVLLLHEGMHGTLFERVRANRSVSVALGGLVLMSYTAYRVMHTRHHDYLGDPRDPDDYHNYTGRRWLVWCLHYVRLVVGTFLYIFLIPIFAVRYGSRADRRAIALEYTILVPAWAAVALVVPGWALAAAWGVPVLVVAYATSVRGFTQHGITAAEDPFLASRSIRAPRAVAFCLLNENFHLEHHLFPEVPSYNLARLHDLLADRIPYRVTGTSYLAFVGRFLAATPRMREEPIGLVRSEAP
jgi:fatty acid desaturase